MGAFTARLGLPRWTIFAIALPLAVLAWWGLGGFLVPTAPGERIIRGTAAEVVYATGVVEPVRWAKVVAAQRKRIVEACSCEGKPVKRGDVLARLDDAEERAHLTELSVRRKRLADEADRFRTLLERNATSITLYEEKLTQVSEFDARIAAQKDRIADLVLTAPMDGTVLRSDAHVGEIAGTGLNDVLFWVGEETPLRINADVNEEDIVRIRPGQSVLLRHDGAGDRPVTARVGDVTPKGDPTTKTFRVYLTLPVDTPLRIGMSVEANVIVREARNVLLMPAEALLDGRVQRIEAGRVRILPVRIGIRGTRLVEVTAGLDEGAEVLTPFRPTLRDGARVRTTQRPSPTNAGETTPKPEAKPEAAPAAPRPGAAATGSQPEGSGTTGAVR